MAEQPAEQPAGQPAARKLATVLAPGAEVLLVNAGDERSCREAVVTGVLVGWKGVVEAYRVSYWSDGEHVQESVPPSLIGRDTNDRDQHGAIMEQE